jgi:hypothetical protein
MFLWQYRDLDVNEGRQTVHVTSVWQQTAMLRTGSIFSMSNQLVSPLIKHSGGDNTHFAGSLSVGQ